MNNLGVFDALISKSSAQQAGYLPSDPYLSTMVTRVQCDQAKSTRKASPMMNRGYFARVECINELTRQCVNEMLLEHSKAEVDDQMEVAEKETNDEMAEAQYQIVNLGCGFDTSSLLKIKEETSEEHCFRVFEVDHTTVVTQKVGILSTETDLTITKLGENDYSVRVEGLPGSSSLRLLACDLNNTDEVCGSLLAAGLDFGIPVLILTECVMVYMDKESCQKLCRSLWQQCRGPSAWISYDMVGVQDRFGQMMLKNLTNADYDVPGFVENPTKASHEELFTSSGWTHASCLTMLEAYRELISPDAKARIARLEIFDEVEEWEMLMSHYCLTTATKS